MRKIIVTISCFLLAHCLYAQSDTILNRYKNYLFATQKILTNVQDLLNGINANGQWSDLVYEDKEWANWQPLIHIKRVEELAWAYSYPLSAYYHKESLLKGINVTLDHWLKKRYKCPNWWHNEIGVPQQMRDIVVLIGDCLSEARLKGALEVIGQFKVNKKGSGANLTWSADIGLHYGLLTNNDSLTQSCRDLIVDEIKINTNDGVQPDYSFHQHLQRLQMYQYGAAFFKDNIRLAWELRNTSFAFPSEKITLLSDFLFKGWQWMARGINSVPGTMDRSASRKDALHSPDIRSLIPFITELLPEKKQELTMIAAHQDGEGALNGFRYYPYSDFAVYQQKDFGFFLKTISDRTLATESINRENSKGHLLNSGDAYLIHNGQEYFNLMPVWNWEYLPGVTSFNNADRIKRNAFAGSVSDGVQGFTSMNYVLQNKDGSRSVSAKKSWFCYDGKIICLVAGLKGSNVDSAYTAMDQCRLNGTVTANNPDKELVVGDYPYNKLKWVYHHNFLYMPLYGMKASVQLQNVSGAWSSINASESAEIIHDKIFMPVLLHTGLSKPISFGYMMTYCKTTDDIKTINKKKGFKLIRNDSLCQAVLFTDGTLMAAFFRQGTIKFNKNKLSVDMACLIMLHNDKIYASDPKQLTAKAVSLMFNNKTYNLSFPENGFSTEAVLLK